MGCCILLQYNYHRQAAHKLLKNNKSKHSKQTIGIYCFILTYLIQFILKNVYMILFIYILICNYVYVQHLYIYIYVLNCAQKRFRTFNCLTCFYNIIYLTLSDCYTYYNNTYLERVKKVFLHRFVYILVTIRIYLTSPLRALHFVDIINYKFYICNGFIITSICNRIYLTVFYFLYWVNFNYSIKNGFTK